MTVGTTPLTRTATSTSRSSHYRSDVYAKVQFTDGTDTVWRHLGNAWEPGSFHDFALFDSARNPATLPGYRYVAFYNCGGDGGSDHDLLHGLFGDWPRPGPHLGPLLHGNTTGCGPPHGR